MTAPYIKLDWSWRDDAKVMLFEQRYGKTALVDWVCLMCLMSEFNGGIDMKDEGARIRVQKALRKGPKAIKQFLDKCAECGLIKKDAWEAFERVGSDRSYRDAEARANRRERAITASQKAVEKRREEKEARG